MDKVFANFKPADDVALHRQITDYINDRILAGELEPGTKIPSLRELADLWQTNYFTVNTAFKKLVQDGLLVRRARLGTFVKQRGTRLNNVGIYFATGQQELQSGGFYLTLLGIIQNLLGHHNAQCMSFFDHRTVDEQNTPPPELLNAIRTGKVSFLLAPQINANVLTWLDRLSIPATAITSTDSYFAVSAERNQSMKLVTSRFKELNCRTVGLISSIRMGTACDNTPTLSEVFAEEVRRSGLTTRKEWLVAHDVKTQEKYGYEAMHYLHSLKEKPEAVFIYPDSIGKGCVNAIMELGIKVPEEMKIIMHRNKEIEFFVPFPCDWLEISAQDYADALLDQLELVIAGRKMYHRSLPLQLIKTPEPERRGPASNRKKYQAVAELMC